VQVAPHGLCGDIEDEGELGYLDAAIAALGAG
jgi:hypothetical protein